MTNAGRGAVQYPRMLRRGKPWLFKVAAAISLTFCIATAVLWVRSYYVFEHVADAVNGGSAWAIRSGQGNLFLDHRSNWDYELGWSWGRRLIRPSPFTEFSVEYQTPSAGLRYLGFGVFAGTTYTWPGHLYPSGWPYPPFTDPRWFKDHYHAICFPHWFLVAVFAALPIRWLILERRRRVAERARRGLCRRCGYDLRASPERRPECGTTVPQKAATTA